MRNPLLWTALAAVLVISCRSGSQESTADETDSVETTKSKAKKATKGDMYGYTKLCKIATEVDKDESIPKQDKLAALDKRVDKELSGVGPWGRAKTAFQGTMARALTPEQAYKIVRQSAMEDMKADWQCQPLARLRALQPGTPPLPNPDKPAPSTSSAPSK